MKSGRVLLCVSVVVSMAPFRVYGAEQAALKNNPFSRPSSETSMDVRTGIQSSAVTAEPLGLIATLVSENYAIANVAGRLVRPGESVSGHILTKVYEDRAEFTREGKRIVVYVKPDLVSEDD